MYVYHTKGVCKQAKIKLVHPDTLHLFSPSTCTHTTKSILIGMFLHRRDFNFLSTFQGWRFRVYYLPSAEDAPAEYDGLF